MKNKSQRHKAANTFKFQPFAERIANINVDIFHQVGHEYEDQTEEEECYFFQAIQKWNVLNLTEGYDRFRRDIKPHNILTLPQLIHYKEHCVNTLINHLKKKDVLCLQPLLELVVALSKDLRKDFYPYYPQFLELLLDLLNTKDTDQLEWTFTCLAYVFKFLWRVLVKDISTVFNALVPLLSDTKPNYINEFAAESFSFVARKVKDKRAFLVLMLKAVKTHKDGISGCSKLLFEMLHGVNGQFHSCADTILPFLFESLSDEKLLKYNLMTILEEVTTHIVENINPQKSELFWKSIVEQLELLSKKWSNKNDQTILENMHMLLKISVEATKYRNGKFLSDPKPILDTIINLYSLSDLPVESLLSISELSVLLLTSSNIKHSQEQVSKLIRKMIGINNEAVLFYLVENAYGYTMFEATILPTFLSYCVSQNFDVNCLKTTASLLAKKSPNSNSGINLVNWSKYNLDFPIGKRADVEKIFLKNITSTDANDILNNLTVYYCSVVCVPHLNISYEKFHVELVKNLNEICSLLTKSTEEVEIRKLLFVMLITLECLVHIANENSDSLNSLTALIMEEILPKCTNIQYLSALKILDLFLTHLRTNTEVVNYQTVLKLNEQLIDNFKSPFHEVRLLTSHVYSVFNGLEDHPKHTIENWNVFELCYSVESTQPHVHTYRDMLNSLEKFTYEKPQMTMASSTPFKLIPIRYLCGVLYMNFQLLWEPVSKIIASQAHGLNVADFWPVYLQELKDCVDHIHNPPEVRHSDLSCGFDLLENSFLESFSVESKPDYVNYRILLWKSMLMFAEVAEAKNRDVTEIFLNFVSDEYLKSNSESALSWNIKQHDEAEKETINDEETTEEDAIKEKLKAPVAKAGGKTKLLVLLQQLKVFGKVKSPKSMYKEPELYRLYNEFLQHKNPEVQKAAMDCLMTYKHKHIVPYKENLYNLIDDKNFKNELTLFRVDTESPLVLPEHREELIPVVMKIVFSKMFAKTGMRTGGKSSGQMRRNMILRFLGACKECEIQNFIQMAFKYYSKFLNESEDLLEMSENISRDIDLEKFIPPKRLQSTLNLLTVVLEQFGGNMSDGLLQYLLRILLIIGAHIKGAFVKNTEVHSGYLNTLRNIRVGSFKILEKYFKGFEKYAWTNVEVNAIFETFIWPYIEKLHIEGIHSPTSLLKLISVWGSNPRYFNLLVKHKPNNTDVYVLSEVMKLLAVPKTNNTVTSTIFDTLKNLLSLEEDAEDIENKLNVDNVREIESNILARLKLDEKLNYGSCILLPHANLVLNKIKSKMYGKNKSIPANELFILSRISELVWEPQISNAVLELLLPIVNRQCSRNAREETVLGYVKTIANLIENVENPNKHIKLISPLFGEVLYSESRKVLCKILDRIYTNVQSEQITLDDEIININILVTHLNSYDSKWIDQPDFTRRLAAFKTIQQLCKLSKMPIDLGILLMYNCYYLIRSEKDLSLRENATYTWKLIAVALIQNCTGANDLEYVLNNTILNLIRAGIKNRNDDVRNEAINLLGHLARECPESHVVLRDLNKLTDKVDTEVDFFENLVHLQVHRHGRALQKFIKVYNNQENAPNPRTLTQFILPFISHYLLTEKYASKNNIIDGAIDATGLVCRLLPWHQYEGLLRFYLDKLRHKIEYQKQLVRLIVVILDAFHFDLSKGYVKPIVQDLIRKKKDGKKNNAKDGDTVEEMDTSEVDVKKDESSTAESMEVDESEATDVKNVDEVAEEGKEAVEDDRNADETQEELDLDELLDKQSADDDEVDDEEMETVEKVLACQKVHVLCKSAATRVIYTIRAILLPQLHKSLAMLTQYDVSHKVNKKKTSAEREEQDLLKVPISLAVVKLLQRLPKGILESNLPGIFMKICTFLKSQLESVRRTARETLQKIMLAIGTQHLRLLLREITPLMTRGYQVHVLVYTVHAVLHCLKDLYKPGDIDNVLLTVISLCQMDLFGTVAEEKEVVKIGVRVSEAKSSKSVDTFLILSQYITDRCLMDLVLPLKEILLTTHSFKTVLKAQECLRQIALGLVDNKFVHTDSLIKFSYGISSESIPQLILGEKKPVLTEAEREKLQRQKEDCFIIPKAPVGKAGIRLNKVKLSLKTNAHVIVEFGLRLCYFLLKRDKIKDDEYLPLLDPFSNVFKKCLLSNHVKLSTVTMQCLSWFMKYELPTMKLNIEEISEAIFAILHKYASAGLSKGDNFDLVAAAFKTMSVLVREVKYHSISTEQLKILLLYVEQDMHDSDRQSIAFNLLKSIIARKLIVPEVHDVMAKVAELSIVSELEHIRNQSRVVFHQYLMDYPLGKKLDQHIAFYLSQLKYDMKFGRDSALDMIQGLVHSFPVNVLKDQSGTLLINLGARLLNDEEPECRKKIASCISSMFSKLPKSDRDPLYEIILLWMKDKKIPHRHMGCQLIGLLISVEKSSFETRIPTLLPLVMTQFGMGKEDNKPGRFVKLQHHEEEENEEKERAKDHQLFQAIQMCLKLCAHCPTFLKQAKQIEKIGNYMQTLLCYPHEWVRMAAAQFLGYIFTTVDIDKVSKLIQNDEDKPGFLYSDSQLAVKTLALDLSDQLQPGTIKSEFAEQIVKNLVFIARILANVPLGRFGKNKQSNGTKNSDNDTSDDSDNDTEDINMNGTAKKKLLKANLKVKGNGNNKRKLADDSDGEDQATNGKHDVKINLLWLTKRLRKIMNREIVEAPQSHVIRMEVFKWIGAVVSVLELDQFSGGILNHLMSPLVREMVTTEVSNAPLRQLAKEVAKMVKSRIGIDKYTEVLSKVEMHLSAKRAERKRKSTQLAITDPEAFAKKKIRRQEKKKEKRPISKRKNKIKKKRVQSDDEDF